MQNSLVNIYQLQNFYVKKVGSKFDLERFYKTRRIKVSRLKKMFFFFLHVGLFVYYLYTWNQGIARTNDLIERIIETFVLIAAQTFTQAFGKSRIILYLGHLFK